MKKLLFAGSLLMTAASATLLSNSALAQTKIGDNPNTINGDAALELETSSKGLLMPRVALTGTSSPSPLSAHVQGMAVYNTATAGNVAPGFYYNNGTRWVRIANAVSSFASTAAAAAASPTAAVDGNIIYDQSCNCAKLFTGAAFVPLNSSDNAQALTYNDTSSANNATPSQRMMGNIIYDLSSSGLKLFNGLKWITPSASPINYVFADTNVANAASPNLRIAGQQIFDNSCSCLKAFVNGKWRLADGSISSDGVGFAASIPSSNSLITVAVSLSLTGSSQQINFSSKDFDNGNNYTAASTDSRFIAPTSGIYHFDVGVLTSTTVNVIGNYTVNLVVSSGSSNTVRYSQPLASIGTGGGLAGISTAGQAAFGKDLKLNAGDEVRVVLNNGVVSISVSLVQGGTYFDGHLVK